METTPCTLVKFIDILGKRWTVPLLQEIHHNGVGFNNLQRSLKKISPKLLNQRLQSLEKLHIVQKDSSKEKSTYCLTSKGQTLLHTIHALQKMNCEGRAEKSCFRCTQCELF